jgi:hypothetical protein
MLAGSSILVIPLGFNFLLIRSSLIGGRIVVKVYDLAELQIFFARNFFNTMDYGTKNRLCALGILLNNRVEATKRVSPSIVDFLVACVFSSCNSDWPTVRALIESYFPRRFIQGGITSVLVIHKHKVVVALVALGFFEKRNFFVEIEKHNPTVFGSSVLVIPFGLNFVLIRCGLIGGHVVAKVYNLAELKTFFSRSYSNTLDAGTENRLRGLGVPLNRRVSVTARVAPGIVNFIVARIFLLCNQNLPKVRLFLAKYLPPTLISRGTSEVLIKYKHGLVVALVNSCFFEENGFFDDVFDTESTGLVPTIKAGGPFL